MFLLTGISFAWYVYFKFTREGQLTEAVYSDNAYAYR